MTTSEWRDLPTMADVSAAQAAGVRRMSLLQPIETAPKDGSKILLAGNSIFADGYWLQSAYNGAGAWIWPYIHKTPFYWMPLPEMPK